MGRFFISKNTGKAVNKILLKIVEELNDAYIILVTTWEYTNVSLPCKVKEYRVKMKEINESIFNEIDQEHYDRVIQYLEDNAIGN